MRRALLFALAPLALGCGAKTGLKVPELGPEEDAAVDLPIDIPVDAPVCEPFREIADLATLDLMLVVDTSGSMDRQLQAGVPGSPTKAEAVTAAVDAFVNAEASEGVGMSLAFFPLIDEEISEFCERDGQCGVNGACLRFDLCLSGGTPCFGDADCGAGDTCTDLRRCQREPERACTDFGGCRGTDRCSSTDFGICTNRVRCLPGDYRRPAVRLRPLPGNADRIVEALEAVDPDGATPTAPALEGALLRARERRRSSPGSKVVVLLATDGFPTACDEAIDPLDTQGLDGEGIPRVADIAAGGAASGVETFVIGVFQEENRALAEANLGDIARAGGTGDAVIVTTDEDVTGRLVEILEELRGAVQTCVYAIPGAGVLPDPEDLSVRLLARGDEPVEVRRVMSAEACDPEAGGYFFDPAVDAGERPGFVELCPASCGEAARPEIDVEMQVACIDEG
ncbi:MAG: VWA domain-containing protein [Myxococcota bacterium]